MATFKRFLDLVRSEVGALRNRALGRDLDDYSDDELVAEIERRHLARTVREDKEAEAAARTAGSKEPEETESPPAARARPKRAASPGAGPPRKAAPGSLASYYANLELPLDADLDAVKRQYRKLMRRYHPDRHVADPEKHKAATELAQQLTRAYMEIKKHLEARRT